MKVSVEVVPKQTVFDEIAGRPVANELVFPVVPNFISKYLLKTKVFIVIYCNQHYHLLARV